MKEEGLRLFIAFRVDPAARREIVRLQEQLWGAGCRGLTRPENLHLTLAFLGQTAPGRLDQVYGAMDRSGVRPMKLYFDRVGMFHRAEGDIWWLGMKEDRVLLDLQSRLVQALRQADFPVEDRSFKPHLTLARRARPRSVPDRLEKSICVHVQGASLMRSQRLDGKLIYTQLYHTS